MARKFIRASSEYLEHNAAVVSTFPHSMACWFVSDDVTNHQFLMGISKSGAPSFGYPYSLLALDGSTAGDPVRAWSNNDVGSGGDSAITTTGYFANTLGHACGVWRSATDRSAYINGGGRGNNAANRTMTSPDRTSIGRSSGTTNNYLSGVVAWPCIWKIGLTDAEIRRLAQGAHPLTVRREAIVAFWPLSGRNLYASEKGQYSMSGSATGKLAQDPDRLRAVLQNPLDWRSRRRAGKAAAGGTFQSAWARNSNAVLGAGMRIG